MIFDDEDLGPRNKPKKPMPLDDMSIEELNNYINAMKEEIIRVEADIKKKEEHKSLAASVFGD